MVGWAADVGCSPGPCPGTVSGCAVVGWVGAVVAGVSVPPEGDVSPSEVAMVLAPEDDSSVAGTTTPDVLRN